MNEWLLEWDLFNLLPGWLKDKIIKDKIENEITAERKAGNLEMSSFLQIFLTIVEKDPTILTDLLSLINKIVSGNPSVVSQAATALKTKT